MLPMSADVNRVPLISMMVKRFPPSLAAYAYLPEMKIDVTVCRFVPSWKDPLTAGAVGSLTSTMVTLLSSRAAQ